VGGPSGAADILQRVDELSSEPVEVGPGRAPVIDRIRG
jgi:hypothetical protein